MNRIKAHIEDGASSSSMEFSIEEVVAHNRGVAWSSLEESDRMDALKEYALWLYSRSASSTENVTVKVDPSTLPH